MKIFKISDEPIYIAGPCSAESREQVYQTALALSKGSKTNVFRAGIWKPRSRPGSFQGRGAEALPWLKEVQDEFHVPVATEIAEPEHLDILDKYGIRIVWLGARTVSNPFSVQKIADALKGSKFSVMVKNPVYPDIELWCGTVERLIDNQVDDIAVIHRGFFPFEKSELRNTPMWEIPIEFRRRFPDIPMICDPSHIAGNKKYINDISQRAFDLNFAGLMLEVHSNPKMALSDSRQQLNPEEFENLITGLKSRKELSDDTDFKNHLEDLREKIDVIDFQLLELLNHRMKYVDEIGEYKRQNNVAVLQLRRWGRILESRLDQAHKAGLSEEFIKQMLELIHKESIARQTEIMKRKY